MKEKKLKFYKDTDTWRRMQIYLPEANRITAEIKPAEKIWNWKGHRIHIDYYPSPESPLKIILLHGVGGNGRLLSFAGIPLYRAGYELLSPDLPGYGLTELRQEIFTYDMWLEMVVDLIAEEKEKDNRPVVLFGFSAGGMLAYQVACIQREVSGVIATCILDQRCKEVRVNTARNPLLGMIANPLLRISGSILPGLRLPMKMVAKMSAIVNNKEFLKLLLKDPASSGVMVPVSFLYSLMTTAPALEPEKFGHCPFLLVHPENDFWTPVELSRFFYDRLACDKNLIILEKAGHFPIEAPGIFQMNDAVKAFLRKLAANVEK